MVSVAIKWMVNESSIECCCVLRYARLRSFCSIGLFIVGVCVVYERDEFDRLRRIHSEHPSGGFLFSRMGDTVRFALDFVLRHKRVSDKVKQEKLAKKAALNNPLVPVNNPLTKIDPSKVSSYRK